MTLINEPASLPSPMWAVVRLLISAGGRYPADSAGAMLSPSTLLPAASKTKDGTFKAAIDTLVELGLVTADDEQLSLTPLARRLGADDTDDFCAVLRTAVLDPEKNVDVAEGDETSGTKDLVRALAWFLSRDPFTALNLDDVVQLQKDAPITEAGKAIANDVRWNRFSYWAPALGLAAEPLFKDDRPRQPLLPDCTVAVRQTIHATWQENQRIEAVDAVERILADLPVLPGGRYARSLGLQPPGHVSAALSFALLCGQDQGWIRLERRSDAARDILLVDHDTASGTRRFSDMTVVGSARG